MKLFKACNDFKKSSLAGNYKTRSTRDSVWLLIQPPTPKKGKEKKSCPSAIMNSDSRYGAAPPLNHPPYSSHAPDWSLPTLDSASRRTVHGGEIVSNSSPSPHRYPAPSHEVNNAGSEKQAGQTLQPAQHFWPNENHQLDALDQEMLAEAHENGDPNQQAQEPHEEEDAELEKSLAWIPKSQGRPGPRSSTPLPVSKMLSLYMTRTDG